MVSLKEHFTNQCGAITIQLLHSKCVGAEADVLRAHAATLDGLIKVLDYVTARRDESATKQDDGRLSQNERAMNRHQYAAYGNVVGAVRQYFGLNTGKKHLAYIEYRNEDGPCRRYATDGGSSSTSIALAKRFDTEEEARACLTQSNDYWAKNGKTMEVDE